MAYQSYQSIPQFQNQMYMQQPYQQPIQGMYMDRLSQLQSQQNPQLQNSFVGSQTFTPLGKIVESIDIVKATDIPMDGNCYYFPKADGTEVYAKRWLSNGTTEVVTYKPSMEAVPAQESLEQKTLHGDILEKLDGIEERIGKIEKSLGNRSTQVRSKKEEE